MFKNKRYYPKDDTCALYLAYKQNWYEELIGTFEMAHTLAFLPGPLSPFETDRVLYMECVPLNKYIYFLPITLSLTESFLGWDTKNLSFNKSWHQELRPPPRWRMECCCWPSWLQSSKAWTLWAFVPILCWVLLCLSPLMIMHIPLV